MTLHKHFIRMSLVAAGVILLAFLCRRIVLTTSSPFMEHLANYVRIFLYLGLFAAWGISVRRRVVQTQVRSCLIAVAALIVIWLTLREFRWELVINPNAKRVLWYCYYLFSLNIPLLALLVSLSLGKHENYRLPWEAALLAVPTAILILLVLTNDLHQLVFRFPVGTVLPSDENYSYGPGFYIVVGWGILCASTAFGVMLSRCRLPRSGKFLWLPLIPFGATVLYVTLYALRVPLFFQSMGDVTVIECLLFTAFFESCIGCGLIPSNTRYGDLFRASIGTSAQIVDRNDVPRYTASGAESLTPEAMRAAETGPVILPEGKRLHSQPVRGGRVLWTEDISSLLALQETLRERREELRERNEFLEMEYEQERQYRRVMEQNRLYDLLQSKTQRQLDQIRGLATVYSFESDPAKKRRILAKIVVLGSYIKRRKDFVLSMEDSPNLPESRLTSALGESYYALELLNIRGVYLVHTGQEQLPGNALTMAYDFFESVAEAVLDTAQYLNVIVANTDNNGLRCTVQTDGTVEASDFILSFPNASLNRDEDGGAEILLPLTGGEDA